MAPSHLHDLNMSGALEITRDDRGLYVPALDLHLDPSVSVPRAFISHAHGDHAGAFEAREVIASTQTVKLLEARSRATCVGARVLDWGDSIDLPIDKNHGGGAARISIARAGHVLGAAQLVIDHPGGRFVYTGDIGLAKGATHEMAEIVPCDAIAIESTFALPIFQFPNCAEVKSEIAAFCKDEIANGNTPIVLAYSLGKAQEIVALLRSASVDVVAHGAVYRMCEAYESLGVPLGIASGDVKAYAEEKKRGLLNAALVTPPRSGKTMARVVKNPRVAYVSGWALLDASVERERADRGFVLSDHEDHDGLMRIVRESGAKRVMTVHGDAAVFAQILNDHGIVANAVESAPIDREEDIA